MAESTSPLKGFSLPDLAQLAKDHFGLEGKLKALPGEKDINVFLKVADDQKYILKIAHYGEERALLDMQNALMQHLAHKSTHLKLPTVLPNTKGEMMTEVVDQQGHTRLLRLLTWVDGDLWADINPQNDALLESLGQACGTLCQALLDFDHPAAHRQFKWNLSDGLWIKEHLEAIEDKQQRSIVQSFIELVEEKVSPQIDQIRKSVIYNDANDYNTLVSPQSIDKKSRGTHRLWRCRLYRNNQ